MDSRVILSAVDEPVVDGIFLVSEEGLVGHEGCEAVHRMLT